MANPERIALSDSRSWTPQFLNSSVLLRWLAVAFAMAFPSVLSWLDFVALVKPGDGMNPAQITAYVAGKLIQFTFPLLCLWFLERRLPRLQAPSFAGVEIGLGFGLLVAAGMIGLYYGLLRDTATFAELAKVVHQKLGQFGVGSPVGFGVFAVFLSVVHSLLEEYYWRWFVFSWLKGEPAVGRPVLLSPFAAILLSGVAFMAHHAILLYVYFPGQLSTAVVPFSLCVAGGGMVWAWLYYRTGSIYSAWLSHLLVDGSLFILGYDMQFVRIA